MLFHYHFWTPHLEETEQFYINQGFSVHQRVGRYQGEFQSFDPPLQWEDFRNKNVRFRIIEMRKGNVNITFGYGKRPKFDHIGFLVSEEGKAVILEKAHKLSWGIRSNDRRTFISTPHGFLVELQTNSDVVEEDSDAAIVGLKISTCEEGLEESLNCLFGRPVKEIAGEIGDIVTLKEAVMTGDINGGMTDPNGVRLQNADHGG